MKQHFSCVLAVLVAGLNCCAVRAARPIEVVTTTFDKPWQAGATCAATAPADATLTIDATRTDQEIVGFGTAVSELSWQSLSLLPAAERAKVLDELCSPDGGNFTVFRTPIGSSDFALDYYSYDDHPGDFAMEKFSIAHDERTLLPLLREVIRRVPADRLKVWASPWCPPKWMKRTGCYASLPPSRRGGVPNDCTPKTRLYEGEDGFICDEAHFKAYALYFRKYVDAYRAAGVPISMVMPQNEFNSAMPYPSCTWTVPSLRTFMGKHLGPALEGSGAALFLGTVERGSLEFVNPILSDPACARYVRGVGFQWGGRQAIEAVHARHPKVFLLQTEQECGNGKNDWSHAWHCWQLMRIYLGNGASVYEYWNLSLRDDAASRWGWKQNSLVTVSPAAKTWRFNVEYYILRHASRFLPRGSRRIATDGYDEALAFVRPDGRTVVLLGNGTDAAKTMELKGVGDIRVRLPPQSVTTVCIP